ncbi:hypothetical protein [Mesonia mobilis]|uniref:hypothetical protein n=1 Tax=Mesonia mobilis TaxID=369791 RepID=UPI0012EB30CB|nr:hypothetical protein [Mesonia mobilis]MBQ0737604.1 hypothetical protein [Aquimarina celericrescens]
MNKITIKSSNLKEFLSIYIELGIIFTESINNNNGTRIYSYTEGDLVYELISVDNKNDATRNIKLPFKIDDFEGFYEILNDIGIKKIEIVKTSIFSRMLFADTDGN